MRSLLLLSLIGIGLAAAPALAQPPIHEQLQQAVDRQDWDQAITIMDQLIEAEAQDKADLEAYRDALMRRQTGESTGSMQAPPDFLIYTLDPPQSPTPEEARVQLLSVCLDEITTIPTAKAEIFCQCTVDQLEQRYGLVELITDSDPVQIPLKDSEGIYESCSPED